MGAFIFQCPRTGMSVQAFAADEPADQAIEPIWCIICKTYHLLDTSEKRTIKKDK